MWKRAMYGHARPATTDNPFAHQTRLSSGGVVDDSSSDDDLGDAPPPPPPPPMISSDEEDKTDNPSPTGYADGFDDNLAPVPATLKPSGLPIPRPGDRLARAMQFVFCFSSLSSQPFLPLLTLFDAVAVA